MSAGPRLHFRRHRRLTPGDVKEHYDVYLGDWMIGETWRMDDGWRVFGQGLRNRTAPSRAAAGELIAERARQRRADG